MQNWFPVSEAVIERLRRYKLSRLALCPGCEFPGRGSEGETRPPARSADGFRRSRTCQCPLPLAVSKGAGSLKGQSGSRSVFQGYRKRNLPARPLSPVVFERAKLISRKQTPHLGTRTTASLACPAQALRLSFSLLPCLQTSRVRLNVVYIYLYTSMAYGYSCSCERRSRKDQTRDRRLGG